MARLRLELVLGAGELTLPLLEVELRNAQAARRQRRALRLRFLQAQILESLGDGASRWKRSIPLSRSKHPWARENFGGRELGDPLTRSVFFHGWRCAGRRALARS